MREDQPPSCPIGAFSYWCAFKCPLCPCWFVIVVSGLSRVRLFVTPVDCSPPGSSVRGILQARILEWVAMPFSRGRPNPRIEPGSPALAGRFLTTEPPGRPSTALVRLLSGVQLFSTPWTAAHQASLSITNSWSSVRFMSVELVMPSNHLIICRPLLLPSVFPSTHIFF